MAIHLIKQLSLFLSILACLIFIPGIALAAPVQTQSNPSIIVSQIASIKIETSLFSDTNLTPQHQQQLQAVRQRRNKEIAKVLNTSQRAKLAKNMHSGDDIHQGLEKLNLPAEQKNLVNAIMQLTDLKMQAISTRYSVPIGKN
ncbi:hypothetical protein [Nodularia chucula]|uniref:hypothetical protein n=1 Tax=Nodularia chucula TaxID=3093667 RepID=UPI0039C6159E